MRLTNRDKFAQHVRAIRDLDAPVIAALLPNPLPTQFFGVGNLSARVHRITGFRVYRSGVYMPGEDEKITNKEVDAIAAIVASWTPPTLSDISVGYEYSEKSGRYSGAERITNIDGKKFAWTEAELAEEIQRRVELYAPREGHSPCAYCGKQNPPENMVDGTVIYRTQGGVGRKVQKYCKDKPCASHDQMAHEG